jgi:hypothetical protein
MKYITKKSTINLFAALGLVLILQACNQQPAYKAVRGKVIALHDRLMGEDGLAMNSKAKLKALETPAALQTVKTSRPQTDTAMEKVQVKTMITRIDSVSNAMSDWMSQFNPDIKGKSDQQAVDYFTAEKVKVNKLDSAYKVILKSSGDYLARFHVKNADTVKTRSMKMKM